MDVAELQGAVHGYLSRKRRERWQSVQPHVNTWAIGPAITHLAAKNSTARGTLLIAEASRLRNQLTVQERMHHAS